MTHIMINMDKMHLRTSLATLAVLAVGLCGSPAIAWSADDVVVNPVNLDYQNALVRLKVDLPDGVDSDGVTVTANGRPVPAQVDEAGRLWVAATVKPMAKVTYRVTDQPAKSPAPGRYDPAVTAQVEALLAGKAARQIADGPLFRRWRVEQDGYVMRVTQQPGKPFALVEESGAADWTLPLDTGLAAGGRQALMQRWFVEPFKESQGLETVALSNDATRLKGAVIELLPRWTQSYDEGWFFGVTDGRRLVAVMPLRAGRWRWPHDAKLTARVDEAGRPILDGSMPHGARYWLLIAGPSDLASRLLDIAKAEGFAPLDKLHNHYVFGPIAADEKPAEVLNFYSNDTNPTHVIRRWGRAAVKDAAAGKTKHALADVYEVQARLDPDWFGRYEHGWSPINPNFYTDFMRLAIAQAAMLRGDPAFPHVRDQAVEVFKSDLDHSVTLPGGAGQECPGYLAHAMEQWEPLAPVSAKYLGYDPRADPRYAAAASFIAHLSHPDGEGGRIFHPGGDTHPGRPEPIGFAAEYGVRADPATFVTEELPGFGVVFRDKSGTPHETYLAFKSGPNRGHYHGDQLSFHYIADGRPLAIDHRVSYSPRAGQEHMHNRVSFSAPGVPWANMDGHERLIAFEAGEQAALAIGQVESLRLRPVKQYPPEDWDTAADLVRFDHPLKYRRTIVMLRDLPSPVFVVYDQFDVPTDDVTATWNLHVKSNGIRQEGSIVRFSDLTVHVIEPEAFAFASFPSTAENWLTEKKAGEATEGARLTARPGSGRFLTVLVPAAAGNVAVEPAPGGVKVGPYAVRFAEGFADRTSRVAGDGVVVGVRRDGADVLRLTQDQVDLNRSQGEIGLFIPDVGYPFGPIPDWLIEQRGGRIQPIDLTPDN